jgi:predicted metal-dependent peptidase
MPKMEDTINLSTEEFAEIARGLEIHHAIFSVLWNLGKPVFTNLVQTAAVAFDEQGKSIVFYFNPVFWKKLSDYERNFIICHECLHVALGHGVRLRAITDSSHDPNIAADIVVNNMLIKSMGFDRSKLSMADDLCWIDTIFKHSEKVEKDRCLEYYYNILHKNAEKEASGLGVGSGVGSIDSHDGIKDLDQGALDDLTDNAMGGLNQDDLKSFSEKVSQYKEELDAGDICAGRTAGTIAGRLTQVVKLTEVVTKKKWETVIRKWARQHIKDSSKDFEQWARTNRRFSDIIAASNLFLPSEMEIDQREQELSKIKVVFFQDTSGSCSHFAKRFFTAASSLPKDKFDVELYCFDTEVYKTSLDSGKLYGFGGTSFRILENYVRYKISNNDPKKYPKAIFVITDGYGDNISPQFPQNWYWFLSSDNRSCIPSACNIFKLSDFE